MNRNIGILLIIIGAVMLIWSGVSYTRKEKVADIGPLQISVDKKQTLAWPPYVGGILLAAGIVMIIFEKKSR